MRRKQRGKEEDEKRENGEKFVGCEGLHCYEFQSKCGECAYIRGALYELIEVVATDFVK